ncbi:hypothetical protein GFB56_11230 [Ensifer sp. T173]|uniref:NADPH-dependent FMN reductase-like domain-containing protein n=1 Tax=Ensifer canadensis TaxID=555315 RepID=A0AAW4FH21_9HYPH|nr:hypothetical protein [Ensifer canadensis]UBI78899.1 NAD(P)H-dependent oxidoreductase [Ensifer canadensis]
MSWRRARSWLNARSAIRPCPSRAVRRPSTAATSCHRSHAERTGREQNGRARIPQSVIRFIEKISASDGLIISSPEYVRSIPCSLKNPIDWLLGPASARLSIPLRIQSLQRSFHPGRANLSNAASPAQIETAQPRGRSELSRR